MNGPELSKQKKRFSRRDIDFAESDQPRLQVWTMTRRLRPRRESQQAPQDGIDPDREGNTKVSW